MKIKGLIFDLDGVLVDTKKKTWFKQKIFSKNSKDKTNRNTKAFEKKSEI